MDDKKTKRITMFVMILIFVMPSVVFSLISVCTGHNFLAGFFLFVALFFLLIVSVVPKVYQANMENENDVNVRYSPRVEAERFFSDSKNKDPEGNPNLYTIIYTDANDSTTKRDIILRSCAKVGEKEYLFAWCLKRNAFRQFALDRIETAWKDGEEIKNVAEYFRNVKTE